MADLFNEYGSVLVPNLDPNAPLPGLTAPVTQPKALSPPPVVPVSVSPTPIVVSPRPTSPPPITPVRVSPPPITPVFVPPVDQQFPVRVSPPPVVPVAQGRLANLRETVSGFDFFPMFANGKEITIRLYRDGQLISQVAGFFNATQMLGFQVLVDQMSFGRSSMIDGTTLTYDTAETGEFDASIMIEDEYNQYFPNMKAHPFMNEDPVALRRNAKRAVWVSGHTIDDVPGAMIVYSSDPHKARNLGINIPWQGWQPYIEGVTPFDARYMRKLDLYWGVSVEQPDVFTFDTDEDAYDFIRGVAVGEQLFKVKVGSMHRTRNLKLPFVFSYDLSTNVNVRPRPTIVDNFVNQPPIAKIMMTNVEMAGFANFIGGHNRIVAQRGEPTLVVELVEPAYTLLLHGDDDELRRQWNQQHMGQLGGVFDDYWINRYSAAGSYFYDPQGASFMMKVAYNNGYGKVPQALLATYLYGVKVAHQLFAGQFGGKELYKLYPLKGADGNFVIYS